MTDRDTFAAAALTGILSRGAWVPEECVTEAYRLADAMLRERGRINHDAAPEATAEPCGKSDAQHPSATTLSQPADQGLGTGNTQEPVAWVAWFDDEDKPDADFLFRNKEQADCWCRKRGADSVPLYLSPQPTLTDEEREAVEHFAATFKGPMALKLRKLLERVA